MQFRARSPAEPERSMTMRRVLPHGRLELLRDNAGTGSGVTPSRSGRRPSRTRVRYLRQISGLACRANCAASVSRKMMNGMSVGWRSALSCPAACARLTRAVDQGSVPLPCVRRLVPAVAGVHHHLPQAAVVGQHPGRLTMKHTRPVHGSGPSAAPRPGWRRAHPVLEQRGRQVFLGPEPPVDGPDPDAGVPRHLVEADLEAQLGEYLRGRFQDAQPVPRGITPQRAAPGRAHPGQVSPLATAAALPQRSTIPEISGDKLSASC